VPPSRTAAAVELMTRFADRTGLVSGRPSVRYLWTDAFAVGSFLGLAAATGDGRYLELACRLVDRVHHVLGRHRGDDGRTGWLSGLDGDAAEVHPTRGGLRIGKPLPERAAGAPVDERGEWDRDGQYFHYLTKWMTALDHVARATRQAVFNRWARELADVAHRAFTHVLPSGERRMYWKCSIDLSRPQVASMGRHDPLDGLVTCRELEATTAALDAPPEPPLDAAAADFGAMVDPRRLATTDALALGGLLVDAYRITTLVAQGRWDGGEALAAAVLDAAQVGLHGWGGRDLHLPVDARLAFRELGLAIGLAGLERMPPAAARPLAPYAALRGEIEAFWLRPGHRETRTWHDHRDINDVMLATSLVPEGFLGTG